MKDALIVLFVTFAVFFALSSSKMPTPTPLPGIYVTYTDDMLATPAPGIYDASTMEMPAVSPLENDDMLAVYPGFEAASITSYVPFEKVLLHIPTNYDKITVGDNMITIKLSSLESNRVTLTIYVDAERYNATVLQIGDRAFEDVEVADGISGIPIVHVDIEVLER